MQNYEAEKNETGAENAVSLVDEFLEKAVESGASDIHFEPTASELIVKYRLDGLLQEVEKLPKP